MEKQIQFTQEDSIICNALRMGIITGITGAIIGGFYPK